MGREPVAGADQPAIGASAQRPEEAVARVARRPFGKGADGIAAAARGAVAAGNAGGEKIIFLGPAGRAPPVGADAQRIRVADRGPQFEATADTGGGDALEQGGGRGVPPPRETGRAS